MSRVRCFRAVLLTGVLSLAGCASYSPVPLYQLHSAEASGPLYQLHSAEPDAQASQQNADLAILLQPVAVASYLQRQALLQRQADGSLLATTEARWAGNLAADIDQQVLRQLTGRLHTQRLVPAPAPAGFEAPLQVVLAITRLDSGPQQPAVLEAQWRVLSKDGQLLENRLIHLQEAHQGAVGDQVRAQSLLLQQLVEQLAAAIKPLAAQQLAKAPHKQVPARPVAPVAKKPEPSIPSVQPVRNNSEVFRF